jgi:hypothetical protein
MRLHRLRGGSTETSLGTSFDSPDPARLNAAIAEQMPEQKPPDENEKIHLTVGRQQGLGLY